MDKNEKRNADGLTEKEFLAGYKPDDYKKPAVTADCLIFARRAKVRNEYNDGNLYSKDSDGNICARNEYNDGIKVLMVRRGNHPCINCYALPGGFCEYGETSEQTARRELLEETGYSFDDLQQLYFISTPNRDPRDWIMTVCYYGEVAEPFPVEGNDDAAEAVWLNLRVEITNQESDNDQESVYDQWGDNDQESVDDQWGDNDQESVDDQWGDNDQESVAQKNVDHNNIKFKNADQYDIAPKNADQNDVAPKNADRNKSIPKIADISLFADNGNILAKSTLNLAYTRGNLDLNKTTVTGTVAFDHAKLIYLAYIKTMI